MISGKNPVLKYELLVLFSHPWDNDNIDNNKEEEKEGYKAEVVGQVEEDDDYDGKNNNTEHRDEEELEK